MTIPFSSIIEGDRARDAKKYGELEGITGSMRSLGSIHPIGLDKRRPATPAEEKIAHEGWVYQLIDGGRRYRCLQRIKPEFLYHASFLNPKKLGFLFADEVPEHTRKEAELDENLYRLNMDWIDSVLLVKDVHEAKRKAAHLEGKRWGETQTGALLGKGYGRSNVNNALWAAEVLRGKLGPEKAKELAVCGGLTETVAVRAKWKEEEALAELDRRVHAKRGVSSRKMENTEAKKPGTESFLDTLNITLGKPKGGDELREPLTTPNEVLKEKGSSPAAPKVPTSGAAEPVVVALSEMFFRCDFRDYIVFLEGDQALTKGGLQVFDHIVTDIPYGIDMDNLDEKQVVDVKAEHGIDQNVSMMRTFLEFAYMTIKPGGFCVFFYDLDHHEKLQEWAELSGFRVQRWPLIACKTSASQNNAAAYNLTKNYEVAMFLRKDGQTVLRHDPKHSLNNTSWKAYNFAAERALYNNPFSKPFELWKDIYDMISFPGQTVLDPFAGEMSACRAAANCGLVPYGIEINEKHYLRGLAVMKSVYGVIHKNNVTFT